MSKAMKKKTVAEKFAIISRESRTCFRITWFESEEIAAVYAEYVKARRWAYNDGWFRDLVCGRDKTWDKIASGRKLYAVAD